MHGAFSSGQRAAKWCIDSINDHISIDNKSKLVAIIGAGAAGIAAAEMLQKQFNNVLDSNNPTHKVIIIEATDHLGGRATTIDMGDDIYVDSGGTWMQQYHHNILIPEAVKLGLTLIPTDFMNPLAAAADGSVSVAEINAMILKIEETAQTYHESATEDVSIMTIINELIYPSIVDDHRQLRILELSIAEIMADTGINLSTLSSKYGLEEPSYVGEGDHYIREGYSSLLSTLATGIDIRYNCPIKIIDWGNEDSANVRLTTLNNEIIDADYCICTIPISLLQESNEFKKLVTFTPPLPVAHQESLSKMKMAICDKVILRFSHRWWETNECSGNNLMKWYGETMGNFGQTYTDMLDVTDGVGAPIVVLYMIGDENVKKTMDGFTDEEIAFNAYLELKKWSDSITRDRSIERRNVYKK